MPYMKGTRDHQLTVVNGCRGLMIDDVDPLSLATKPASCQNMKAGSRFGTASTSVV